MREVRILRSSSCSFFRSRSSACIGISLVSATSCSYISLSSSSSSSGSSGGGSFFSLGGGLALPSSFRSFFGAGPGARLPPAGFSSALAGLLYPPPPPFSLPALAGFGISGGGSRGSSALTMLMSLPLPGTARPRSSGGRT